MTTLLDIVGFVCIAGMACSAAVLLCSALLYASRTLLRRKGSPDTTPTPEVAPRAFWGPKQATETDAERENRMMEEAVVKWMNRRDRKDASWSTVEDLVGKVVDE